MFPATYWKPRPEKETEFYAELLKATGIAREDAHWRRAWRGR